MRKINCIITFGNEIPSLNNSVYASMNLLNSVMYGDVWVNVRSSCDVWVYDRTNEPEAVTALPWTSLGVSCDSKTLFVYASTRTKNSRRISLIFPCFSKFLKMLFVLQFCK
jgi:hypothetical protein